MVTRPTCRDVVRDATVGGRLSLLACKLVVGCNCWCRRRKRGSMLLYPVMCTVCAVLVVSFILYFLIALSSSVLARRLIEPRLRRVHDPQGLVYSAHRNSDAHPWMRHRLTTSLEGAGDQHRAGSRFQAEHSLTQPTIRHLDTVRSVGQPRLL